MLHVVGLPHLDYRDHYRDWITQQSFNTIKDDIAIKNVVPVPHPNARAQKGKCKWGEYEIPDFTFKSKLDIYKTAIKEHLKSF